jgi:predicted acetyltransferase
MPIELTPAALEQMPILANLLELYVYEFSEMLGLQVGENGRFGYDRLPLYWQDRNRFPFLIRNGALAGFVLVKRGSEVSGDKAVWDMAEMFVVRSQRRHGIATQVAHEVWRRFPGRWEVRVMETNPAALAFWAHAVASFKGVREATPCHFERPGKGAWNVFAFDTERSPTVEIQS